MQALSCRRRGQTNGLPFSHKDKHNLRMYLKLYIINESRITDEQVYKH